MLRGMGGSRVWLNSKLFLTEKIKTLSILVTLYLWDLGTEREVLGYLRNYIPSVLLWNQNLQWELRCKGAARGNWLQRISGTGELSEESSATRGLPPKCHPLKSKRKGSGRRRSCSGKERQVKETFPILLGGSSLLICSLPLPLLCLNQRWELGWAVCTSLPIHLFLSNNFPMQFTHQ